MDDEDGRCLLDVICDPEALNDFLHGLDTHCHIPEVLPPVQLLSNEQPVLPRVSVDLDFLEDDVILGKSPSGSNTMEPCDILQQSLAEANITEQSLQEAEAELDLGSFDLTMPGLTQVVQTLPCTDILTGSGETAVGVGLPIFPEAPGSSATPPQATADMLGSVLAQQGLEFGPQVMNKAQTISMQPFIQQVAGLGNVTLQPIASLQALPNGCQSGHLGLGQIQVMGQPTVMTMNQSGQPILAKSMGGYQLHQPGPEAQGAGGQGGLGGGLLIHGGKATLGSPVLNGPALGTNSNDSTITAAGSLGQQGQNLIIQRTPTPIQPKPPQGGSAIQPKLFKQQQAQPHTLQNDANKALGAQVPVSAAQNVAFLTGKPGANVVLASQAGLPQQALFKQQTAHHPSGKALSVHLLNQPGSIMLGGQNHQFLLPQQLAGGQILTQHPGGHIITSRGPGGQLIANQILAQHQNINLGQVLTSQGHPLLQGHIQLQPGQMGLGHQLFQMPVTLSQSQSHPVTGHQAHTVIQGMPLHNSLAMLSQVEGLSPAVSLQPALQPQPGGVPSSGVGGAAAIAQGQPGGSVPMRGSSTDQAAHPGQAPQPSILSMQAGPSVSMAMSVPSSSPSLSVSTTLVPHLAQQHSPGSRVLFTGHQGSSMILSQEHLQMFLQQDQRQTENDPVPTVSVGVPASVIVSSNSSFGQASSGHDSQLAETAVVNQMPQAGGQQQQLKLQSLSPSQPLASHTALPLSDSPQPSPLHMHSPQSWPPSQPQTPARSCTPSSLPPMFIIQNQIPGHSQPALQQQQQIHLQPRPPSQPAPQQQQIHLQPRPPSQPALYEPDVPPPSRSPKPPQILQAPLAGLQFTASQVGDPGGGVLKTQVLTAERQHRLQLVGAQPSPQQKHQVQQNILLQAKRQQQSQPQPQQHGGQQQDVPAPATAFNDLLSGAQVTQGGVAPANQPGQQSLHQAVKVGGVESVSGLSQMTSTQQTFSPCLASLQTQTAAMKLPFSMAKPSKEARMLEQLRKQQGSVLHPDYRSSFQCFEDTLTGLVPYHLYQGTATPPHDYDRGTHTLTRLVPYHLYQGTATAPHDYLRVDDEFERVSSQLLKRTQAMLDKYRHLLFEESTRLGPSAEMVMMDRMFIQEEKISLGQDRILARDRPDEYVANSRMMEIESGAANMAQSKPQLQSQLHHKPQPHPQPLSHPQPHPQLHSEPQLQSEPHPQPLSQPHPEPQPHPQPLSQPHPEPLSQPHPEPLSQPHPEPLSQPHPEPLSQPHPEPLSQPHPEPQPHPQPLSQPHPQPLSQPHPESLSQPHPEPQPEPLTQPHPEPQPHPQPLSQPHPEPQPQWFEPSPVRSVVAPAPAPTPIPDHFPSTKLVIKQGGAGASVSWSSSPAPVARPGSGVRQTADTQSHSSSFSRAPPPPSRHSPHHPFSSSRPVEDDDTLPRRTSKPPMKTYAGRPRIGLKLKIKQEAGFSKVVHNTALDPVHTPSTPNPKPQPLPTTLPHPAPPLPTTLPHPALPLPTTLPHPAPALPTTRAQPAPALPTPRPQPAPALPTTLPHPAPALPTTLPHPAPALPTTRPQPAPALPTTLPQPAPALPTPRPQPAPALPTTRPQPTPALPTTRPQPAPALPTTRPQPVPALPTTRPQPAPALPTTRPQPAPALPTTLPHPAPALPKAQTAARATPPSITVIRTPPPSCNTASSAMVSIATTQATPSPQRVTAPASSSTAQMNGALEHHNVGGVKRNPASTATSPQTTCRLPLRKTYRENISPRVRPGVPGGGGDSVPYPRPSPSPPNSPPPPSSPSPSSEGTVITSMKLEKRGGSPREGGSHTELSRDALRLGKSSPSSPGLVQGITNTQQHLSDREEERGREGDHWDRGADMGRYKRVSSKNHQRSGGGGGGDTFRMDQHAPGPPSSPPDTSCYRDSSLPAKRCKSDSPVMDNASFSSGSPPHDESLNEHLQCAIDTILNLQGQDQGPTPRRAKGGSIRPHHHHSQRPTAPQPSSHTYRPSVSSSSSSSLAHHSQVGGRGLVPQTHSR
ncbi:BRD4-interacting chromatin-remodeling complex-associated protein isoform X2 [Oncorhynchus kisutch]|uniref:BRD4 interacting chromatin remodeling complex associated protein n=1 Tax=Oncorhynchus kisutch TaxID=8019 RepID=A0A8C7I5D9_ONCKI|nr:BRD4-interacting chromatin-remodeling complex-associated protein-like isoform X2 [Oncorhynchus kisutch]